jgi:hypothetical protein
MHCMIPDDRIPTKHERGKQSNRRSDRPNVVRLFRSALRHFNMIIVIVTVKVRLGPPIQARAEGSLLWNRRASRGSQHTKPPVVRDQVLDTARDSVTLDHVDAEALWAMEVVNTEGYICRG